MSKEELIAELKEMISRIIFARFKAAAVDEEIEKTANKILKEFRK